MCMIILVSNPSACIAGPGAPTLAIAKKILPQLEIGYGRQELLACIHFAFSFHDTITKQALGQIQCVHDKHTKTGTISFGIHPEYACTGMERHLWNLAHQEFIKLECSEVMWRVEPAVPVSHACYQAELKRRIGVARSLSWREKHFSSPGTFCDMWFRPPLPLRPSHSRL